MPHRSVAKITRPTPKRVAVRARLLARLDHIARSHAVAWVSAPAGSGKTTLAASWLAARRRPCLWYQLDSGDADPAAFFFYLREAAHRLSPRRRENLPLLTPEYALGIAAYSRNFFEVLAARVPPGTVIVLDNYQDLPEDAPLHAVLPQALSVLPDRVRVLVLSRSAPPASFARLITDGAVGFLGADELNLSAAETQALARARTGKQVATAVARELCAETGGWVAGTVLLLEAPGRALPAPRSANTPAQQVLFDYFASEIFDRAPLGTQKLLLATAVLPEVSVPAAKMLADEPQAAEILAELVRRNYFTLRLAGDEPLYRFHPLFREFLLSRAKSSFPVEVLTDLRATAARTLDEMGRWEAAASLFIEACDWQGLAQIVFGHAAELLRHGRGRTLEQWLRAMPLDVIATSPWLSYWLGAAVLSVDVAESRARFETAFGLFTGRDDAAGSYLSWCGIVDTYIYAWDDLAPLDRWIAEAEILLREQPEFPSPEIEARFTYGMFCALMYRQAHRPDMPIWEERATAIALGSADAFLRTAVASHLVWYHSWWTGDQAKTAHVLNGMRGQLQSAPAGPLFEVSLLMAEAAYCFATADHARCSALVEEGLRLAEKTGVRLLDFSLCLVGSWTALSTGRLDAAARYLRRITPALDTMGRTESAMYQACLGWKALCDGDFSLSAQHARASVELVHGAGPPPAIATFQLMMAEPLIEQREFDQANSWLEKGHRLGTEIRSNLCEYVYWLLDALCSLRRGDRERALDSLREHLHIVSKTRIVNRLFWRSSVMAELYAEALEAGIETELVTSLIQKRELVAPSSCRDLERWPWSFRIYMLGRFELQRDGAVVSFGAKTPRKPLELLRALIAFGGANVREETLADALWPDAEGHAAAHALETTIYRLRKLLGSPGAVVQRDGRVTLDPRMCWVDALALSRLLARGLDLVAGANADAAKVRREVERVLALYRGPLVRAGHVADAAEMMRRRLRTQLLRFLEEAARHLGSAGEARLATAYVARAREADPDLDSLNTSMRVA